MKRFLLKILLLIFKFLLKIAKIFAFKKLESFIGDFLKKSDSLKEELPIISKISKPQTISPKLTLKKKEFPQRDEKKEKEEKGADSDITPSESYDDTSESSMVGKAMPIIGTAAVVAAGVGIASIVRNKNEKPKEGKLTDAEFNPDETYMDLFMKGFKEVTGTDYVTAEHGKSAYAESFAKGVKGKSSDKGLWFSDFIKNIGKREYKQRPQRYQQHYQANKVGQSMDFMKGYLYNQKAQSVESRRINEIIIHCTATPEGREVSLQELYNWHVARDFIDIGYHFVVHIDGTIESARPLNIMGAHCEGHNAHSIGISYVGGTRSDDPQKPKDTRTEAQRAQIWNLVYYLLRYFPSASVHGHNEYANKACPCFDVQQEWKELWSSNRRGGYAVTGTSTTRSYSSTQINDDLDKQGIEREIVMSNESL